jgi:hypothetical protein
VLKRGGALVCVTAAGEDVETVVDVMNQYGAVDGPQIQHDGMGSKGKAKGPPSENGSNPQQNSNPSNARIGAGFSTPQAVAANGCKAARRNCTPGGRATPDGSPHDK